MITFSFHVGGSAGKGDSWDYELDFDLTEEEAARLEASARKHPGSSLDEDPEVADIYEKVYAAAYENELSNIPPDLIKDTLDDYLSDDENWKEPEYSNELGCWIKKAKPISDRELAILYFDDLSFDVDYPFDLQDLDPDEE